MAKKRITTFLGASQSLVTLGSHAYGYSGALNIGSSGSSADISFLSFTTGSFYTLGNVTWTNTSVGADTFFEEIQINGVTVYQNDMDGSPDKQAGKYPLPLMIPPNSTVKVQALQSNDNGFITCILTGYRV